MVSRGETNEIIFYVTETLVEEMLFLSHLTAIAYNALFLLVLLKGKQNHTRKESVYISDTN